MSIRYVKRMSRNLMEQTLTRTIDELTTENERLKDVIKHYVDANNTLVDIINEQRERLAEYEEIPEQFLPIPVLERRKNNA